MRYTKPYVTQETSAKYLLNKININILRIAKQVPVEHPQFAGENN